MLMLLVASVPFYFYAKMTLQNTKKTQIEQLREYGSHLEEQIYTFGGDTFLYPRSFVYESAIYDSDKTTIFSLTKKSFDISLKDEGDDDGYLYVIKELKNNRLNARYLLCAKKFEPESALIDVGILTLFLIMALFVSNYLVIRMSIKPYSRLNSIMEEFFDDAMHELKTPLGVLKINIELLKSKIEDNKNLTRANGAIMSLSTVYEDLEYWLKNKNHRYPKESINLSYFLQERCEQFLDLALSKSIIIENEIESEIFSEINRIELQRIIDNNLSNAIKYSHQDSKIIVSLRHLEGFALIEFIDFGIGIKDVDKIFERHYREDEIKGGFGIGLSIVKKICEKYGIKIEIESEQGKGSLFRYYIKSETETAA